MYRVWSIADGPADLTDQDIGTTLTVTVATAETPPRPATIDVKSVGAMHGGDIRSFSGQLSFDGATVAVIGTYNTRDRTGSCHTTDA